MSKGASAATTASYWLLPAVALAVGAGLTYNVLHKMGDCDSASLQPSKLNRVEKNPRNEKFISSIRK